MSSRQRFNRQQKTDIFYQFLLNNRSPTRTTAALKRIWGDRFVKVHTTTMHHIEKVFLEYGSVQYQRKRKKSVRVEEKIEQARALTAQASSDGRSLTSVKLAPLIGASQSTTWRILRHDLKLKPYRIKLLHKLNEDDFDRRVEWCDMVLDRMSADSSLLERIIWTDEAIFSLAQTVNRHNCVYWDSSNPNRSFEADNLGCEKVMVWCGIWAGGRIGPFFYSRSVNGKSYEEMLRTFVFPKLAEIRDDWESYFIFQQDGAAPHYAVSVRRLLDETFDEWLGRRGTWEWPARSPDLTVCDFYLWGRLKDKVFASDPRTMDQLKIEISDNFHDLDQSEISKACKSVEFRCRACIALEGRQLKLHKDYS